MDKGWLEAFSNFLFYFEQTVGVFAVDTYSDYKKLHIETDVQT